MKKNRSMTKVGACGSKISLGHGRKSHQVIPGHGRGGSTAAPSRIDDREGGGGAGDTSARGARRAPPTAAKVPGSPWARTPRQTASYGLEWQEAWSTHAFPHLYLTKPK